MDRTAQRHGGRPAGIQVGPDGLSDRQHEILNFIGGHIKQYGYPPSMREVGAAVGLASTSSVSHQVRALETKGFLRQDPKRPRAYVLAKQPPSRRPSTPDAADTTSEADQDPSAPQFLPATPGVEVPVVGRIAAGTPITAEQHIDDLMTLPRTLVGAGDIFALSVAGESMTGAGILDGDLVAVRRQPTADDGDIVAALLEGEATVKRLKRDGATVWLVPENSSYDPIPGNHADILGKVVAVLRRL